MKNNALLHRTNFALENTTPQLIPCQGQQAGCLKITLRLKDTVSIMNPMQLSNPSYSSMKGQSLYNGSVKCECSIMWPGLNQPLKLYWLFLLPWWLVGCNNTVVAKVQLKMSSPDKVLHVHTRRTMNTQGYKQTIMQMCYCFVSIILTWRFVMFYQTCWQNVVISHRTDNNKWTFTLMAVPCPFLTLRSSVTLD